LREHREDIPMLAGKLLGDLAERYRRPDLRLSAEAMAAVESYGWPGNVRQLFNALECAVVQSEGPVIRAEHLLPEVTAMAQQPPPAPGGGSVPLTRYYTTPVTAEEERALILRVIEESRGNKAEAARRLGMSRTTLWKRLSRDA
jgi:DNA-binding NtrC family response regulator